MDLAIATPSPIQAALREGAQRLREGADSVLREGDLEGVHLLRTSARRLRAALKHLGRPLEARRRRALSRELRRFMRALGPVRDLDVFLAAVEGTTQLTPSDAERLRAVGARSVERRMPALRSAIGGPRFAGILSALDSCAQVGVPASSVASDAPSRILLALFATVGMRPDSWEQAEPERLHELRKSIKRLRYTLEACQGSFGRAVRRMIERCREMQEALGALQDVATFRRILRGNRSFAGGQFLALAETRMALVRASLPRLWQKAFSPGRIARLGAHLCRRAAQAIQARPEPQPVPLPAPLQLPPAEALDTPPPRSAGA